jgi:hypothetical protein
MVRTGSGAATPPASRSSPAREKNGTKAMPCSPQQPQVPDQTLLAEICEDAEVLRDGRETGLPEIHEVEVVHAKPVQVLLDQRTQMVRPGEPGLGGAHLGGDDQILVIGRECLPDGVVGPLQSG